MATRQWTTTAVHRLTLLVYPSGDASMTVQSRDLPSLAAVSALCVGTSFTREGVYYTRDGLWVFERELHAPATPTKPRNKDWDNTEQTTATILAAMQGKDRVRAKDLRSECCGETLPSRSFYRHLRRLTRMGVVARSEDCSHGGRGRCVYYSATDKTVPLAQ